MNPFERERGASTPETKRTNEQELREQALIRADEMTVADDQVLEHVSSSEAPSEVRTRGRRNWNLMRAMTLGLALFKVMGASAEAGQAGEVARRVGRDAVWDAERGMQRRIRAEELRETAEIREAADAIHRLERERGVTEQQIERIVPRLSRVRERLAEMRISLMGVPGAIPYAQTVESYKDADIEYGAQQDAFVLRPLDPSAEDYRERIDAFTELLKRRSQLEAHVKALQNQYGWQGGREPREITRYREALGQERDFAREWRALESDLDYIDLLVQERSKELRGQERDARRRSFGRELKREGLRQGGRILRDHILRRR